MTASLSLRTKKILPPWLPVMERTAIEEFGVRGRPIRFGTGLAAVFGVLFVPAVGQVTGVTLLHTVAVWSFVMGYMSLCQVLFYRRARTNRAAFYALIFTHVTLGALVCLSFPVLVHRPDSSLWLAFGVMACVNGAAEVEPSLVMATFHSLAPMLTIPFFLRQGHPWRAAVLWPVTVAAISGYGYRYLARRREHWRRDRHEREIAMTRLRLAESEKERARLARDLHDTVGTTISLVALYGSLAERHAENAEFRRLANTIRQAAQRALGELRLIAQSIPPGASCLRDLARALASVANRYAGPLSVDLNIRVTGGEEVVLPGPVRMAIARVFQEAVHNAVHHGRASRIDAEMAANRTCVRLDVSDNGSGFDIDRPLAGTGVAGIKARAQELGGKVHWQSSGGGGTQLRLELPIEGSDDHELRYRCPSH